MNTLRQKRWILILIFVVGLWSALALLSDTREIIMSIKLISTKRILAVLALSAANYWIRILRFNWFTRRVAQAPINQEVNSIIFFSGLAMNLTPARLGEVVKAYFQHHLFGESFARMAPIVFFERLTDSIAMLLLMSLGVLSFRIGLSAYVAISILVAGIVVLLHQRRLGADVINVLVKRRLAVKLVTPLGRLFKSSFELTGILPVVGGSLLGLVAWALEASGLWILAGGIGIPLTLRTLYLSWFTFAASAAVGFISIIPAGLGINELSTIGLMEELMGMSLANAVVVTFAFRLVTLWFGVLLGISSIIYLEKRMVKRC